MIDYNYFRNLLIYYTLQFLDRSYLKKALPDYLNDDFSWADMVGILKIKKCGCKIEKNEYAPLLLKVFFVEGKVNGKPYYRESLISEKIAAIELCLDVAKDLKKMEPNFKPLLSV